MKWADLTTPPKPRRAPVNKAPLFTTQFQTTKSFSPGHIVGTGILVLGVAGIAKLFIDRGRTTGAAQLATAGNVRGQYGKAP